MADTTTCGGVRWVAIGAIAMLAASADPAQAQSRAGRKPVSFEATLAALDVQWTLTLDAPPAAPAGFDETSAYVPLKTGEIVAVEMASGAVRWRIPMPASTTPAAGDGLVFIGGDGLLTAVDRTSGDVVWRTSLPGRFAAPLHWDTGWLIAATDGGDLVAFRAADGQLVWRQTLSAPVVGPPVPALDQLYVALADGHIVAIDLATGARTWALAVPGRATGLLAIADHLIAGTTGNEIYSLDLRTGRIRWRWRIGADVAGPAVADERRIYVAARDNIVRALDRRTGNLRWTRPLASRPSGGPLRVGGVLLVPQMAAALAVFDAATGAPLSPLVIAGEPGSPPFVRAGARPTAPRLLALSREGVLQAFAAQVEPPLAPLSELPGAPALP